MARRKARPLDLRISDRAQLDLLEIWTWNASHASAERADAYISKLLNAAEGLRRDYVRGRPVEDFPDLYRIVVRRRPKDHGHVIVYRVTEGVVDVLHIFHTAQDWLGRLG